MTEKTQIHDTFIDSSYKLGVITHFLEIPSPGKSPASWVKAKVRVVVKTHLPTTSG